MKKIIFAAVAIGLVTLSAAGPVQAKKFTRFQYPTAAAGTVNGPTDTTSPGDAFSPDTAAVGDPKAECLEQGGRPVRIAGEYDFTWSCKL